MPLLSLPKTILQAKRPAPSLRYNHWPPTCDVPCRLILRRTASRTAPSSSVTSVSASTMSAACATLAAAPSRRCPRASGSAVMTALASGRR